MSESGVDLPAGTAWRRTEYDETLARAQTGCPQALGALLEGCRQYLLLVANAQLEGSLRTKAGASDLVQETFLKAQRNFTRFAGETESELLAWLRTILLRNLADLRRRYHGSAKRRLRREVPLDSVDARGRAGHRSGSAIEEACDTLIEEEAGRVESALQGLPDDYRRVLEYRHRHDLSFQEIGVLLGRSPDAARMLWRRALVSLSRVARLPGADS